jgi:hypothetical protein
VAPDGEDADLADVLAENGTTTPLPRTRARVTDPEWLASTKAKASDAKPTAARRVARIELAEHLLVVCGWRRRKVKNYLRDFLGISAQRAQPIVSEALARIEAGTNETRAQRIALLDAEARELKRLALEHHKPITVGDGIGLSHVELWPEPNEAAAIKALEFRARLHGDLEQPEAPAIAPTQVHVLVLNAMQQAFGYTPPEAIDADAEPEDEDEPAKLTNGHGGDSDG